MKMRPPPAATQHAPWMCSDGGHSKKLLESTFHETLWSELKLLNSGIKIYRTLKLRII